MAPICCDPVFAVGTGAHASTALQGLAASSFIKAAPPASPIPAPCRVDHGSGNRPAPSPSPGTVDPIIIQTPGDHH
jgi:hypothetical protein